MQGKTELARKITEITRRDILDALVVESVHLYGRLEETEFLSRVWDLGSIPSTDPRFRNAAEDIWQHRINNYDWEDDWLFYDSRFGLVDGNDETFLRFLCETIHPVVRPDVSEARHLCQIYNTYLNNDDYELVEKARVSGKPVYIGRYMGLAKTPGLNTAREVLSGTDVSYVTQQITRMESAVNQDPELAIGTAKELVETCCKSILAERGVPYSKNEDLPKLVKATVRQLQLTPDDIPDQAKASETIKRLLSNLATITQGVAQLRNYYGTGHGKAGTGKGLQPRHAKLAVGAASTLAVFLAETHRGRKGKDQNAANQTIPDI